MANVNGSLVSLSKTGGIRIEPLTFKTERCKWPSSVPFRIKCEIRNNVHRGGDGKLFLETY